MRRGKPNPQRRPPLPRGPFLVVGLGRAGRAAAEGLAAHAGPGAVRIWTEYEAEAERPARNRLEGLGVRISIGGPEPALELDPPPGCVVKSPGLEMRHPVIVDAGRRGIPVIDELELGWRLGAAPVIGVTGTNGKGTVTHLIADCLRAAGDEVVCTGNRLVEPPYSVAEEPQAGWVVCEASSYQLEATTAFLPEVGVFTNLTHEHLHRHGDMAGYAESKRRMFVRGDRCVGLAVVNADDHVGLDLKSEVVERGGAALTFGTGRDADFRLDAIDWTLDSGRARVATEQGSLVLESRLPGPHNAFNLVAALAVAEGIGVPREIALETLAVAEPIPGRLQPIREGQPFDAIVDFAHTPDAVRQVLLTIRRVLRDRRRGRLIAVIGVIGGGDPSKRPPLGRITRELADVAVLSSGAPAAETPEAIAAGLAEGARRAGGGRFEVVPPRRAAIERAVELARPGDIVMVLGRGSMRSMKVSREGEEVDFDDREVLREVLRSRQPDSPPGARRS